MNRNFYSVLFAVVVSFVFVAVMVSGASTISTNISTDGTLAVTGVSTLTGQVFASSTVVATGRIQTYGQLVLQNSTSNPASPASGAIYYDSTNRVVKLYNGSDWLTVASSTDANGGFILSGSAVLFNTIGTGYLALGTSTLPIATSTLSNSVLLHLDATTTATVPLQITGVIGQTGDLIRAFQVTAAAGYAEVFAVDAVGGASTTVLSTTRRADNAFVVSGYATTSGATGNFATEGTLTVTGAQTFTGAMTANGAVTLGDALADAISIVGAASTTNSLNVGTVFSVRGMATTTVSIIDGMATTTIGTVGSSTPGSALIIGTTTPGTSGEAKLGVNGDVAFGKSTGTTTLYIGSSAVARGGCIQLESGSGVIHRLFVNAAGTVSLVVEAGPCTGGGAGN